MVKLEGTAASTDVEVRPMVKEDSSIVARLMVEGFRAKSVHMCGEKGIGALIRGVAEGIVFMEEEFYRILVATCNNKPAGVVHLRYHDSKDSAKYERTAGKYLNWRQTIRVVFSSLVTHVSVKERECYVDHICCDEGYRGRGIGGQLMRAAEAQARERGCTSMSLLVAYDNRARSLYERQGYVVTSSIDSYWWLLAVGVGKFYKMEKELK